MTGRHYFTPDVQDFLFLLFRHKVKYLIIGGEAVIYYGYARVTGDIDIYYETKEANCESLFNALSDFWGNDIPGISNRRDLMKKGEIIQFGIPPNRIDLINSVDGIGFKEAWENKKEEEIPVKGDNIKIYYIGIGELIKNKRATGRHKDKDDLRYLTKI
jgi:hypothetical protein